MTIPACGSMDLRSDLGVDTVRHMAADKGDDDGVPAATVLGRLAATIQTRRTAATDTSYTRQLLDAGVPRCAKKLGEEAVEVVIASLHEDDDALKGEAADLVYHLLVLLEARGLAIEDVLATLERRMGTSGIDEKASRDRKES
jgi:phosphoribosyl-ATP pyrophosphohydrolase